MVPLPNGCSIDDFAAEGLTSAGDGAYLGGVPASVYGIPVNYGAAFPGANPNVGVGSFILPIGKSAYDALQVVVQQQKQHPMPGIVSSNAQISYNFSEAVTNGSGGSNQFFVGSSSGGWNQDYVNRYIGRNDLDHTNMLSLAGSFTVKYGPQIALVGHFFSAPPSNLTLSNAAANDPAAQIFRTDVDGDGTTSDLVPGTAPGDYMHAIKGAGLEKMIQKLQFHAGGNAYAGWTGSG